MRDVIIDCAGTTTVEDFWERYVAAARPCEEERFGRNLDAFWDAIESGGPGWPGEVTLVFKNSAGIAHLQTSDGGSFLEALRAMSQETRRLTVQLS